MGFISSSETNLTVVKDRIGYFQRTFEPICLVGGFGGRSVWANFLNELPPSIRLSLGYKYSSGMFTGRVPGVHLIVLMHETGIKTHNDTKTTLLNTISVRD